MIRTRYLDLDCIALRNASLELLITESVGPRIISLKLHGKENVLAELPHLSADVPGADEPFRHYGGHRLWHAPQSATRTHLPDNRPVAIEAIANGVSVVQETEAKTGIQKSLHITLPDDSPTVIIDHMLTNNSLWPVQTAPWAITQMREGGVAICPQNQQVDDADGFWPNRSIMLWPYTQINDPHIHWGDRFIFVDATMQAGALKIGFPNPDGWLAYHVNGTLFMKQAAFDATATYFDRGSSSQIYCTSGFIELEMLGPSSTIQPGASVCHREIWTLYPDIDFNQNETDVADLMQKLKLN